MKLNLGQVNYATTRSSDTKDLYAYKALSIFTDPERKERLQSFNCVVCFYIHSNRTAGQAITPWECQGCDAPQAWSNTAVPKLCIVCAKKYGLCRSCLADLELRPRQKLERVSP